MNHEAKHMATFTSDGNVFVGTRVDGFFRMSPESARTLARNILIMADEAEGVRPSHVYQVQAFDLG